MYFDRLLKYALVGGIFLVPFLVLVVVDSFFFPFITGKNFAFRILVELLFGGWLILALRNPLYRPSFSWLLAVLGGFVAVVAVADLFGENPFKSFWSNFERMEGLVTMLHLFAYFLVAGTVLSTEKLWNWFWHTSVGVSVIIGFYGLLQLSNHIAINQGGVRLDATFGNASYLAIYMLFHIFLTAILMAKWKGVLYVRFIYGSIIFLQLIVLYYTATRGAILGLIGGALLTTLLLALFGKQNNNMRRVAIGALALIVTITGLFVAIKDTSFVKESPVLSRLSSINLEEGSTRFTIWGMAWEGVKEKPVLGWGQENFNIVFNKYYHPSLFAQEPWFDRVHNIVLDWLIATGIVGALFYFSIPIVLLYYIWRKRNQIYFSTSEKSLLTGLLAGYFFHNLFVFDNITSYIFYFSILAYVYALTRDSVAESNKWSHVLNRGVVNRLFVPVILTATLFLVYMVNIVPMQANQKLIQAISPQAGGIEVNLNLFRELTDRNQLGSQEIAEQFVQATFPIAASDDVDLNLKQQFFDLSKKAIEEQIEQDPQDARRYVFLVNHSIRFGQLDVALVNIKKAQELSPNKQAFFFTTADIYLRMGDLESALEMFQKAYELDTTNHRARSLYAAGAIANGKDELGESLLKPLFENEELQGHLVFDSILINAYASRKNYERLVDLWGIAVKLNPDDLQARLSLAASHVSNGDSEEAIRIIEQVIILDPNFSAQGNEWIRQIQAGNAPDQQ